MKKVGLALGGGAAKGFAHVGVLKVLEEYGIKVDMVSGTSIGSVVGALHCAGYSGLEMEQEVLKTKWPLLIDLGIPLKGLVKGKKVEDFLRKMLDDKQFKDLNKKFFVTAVDIDKSQEVVFNKGDVTKAVRASISIPGIFQPVSINNRILVDGGVLDPLPVEILKKAGCDVVIAVNLHPIDEKNVSVESVKEYDSGKLPSMPKVIAKTMSIIQEHETRKTLENCKADLIITPKVQKIGYQDFHKSKEAIALGEEAARQEIKKIQKLQGQSFWKRFFS